MAEGHFQDQQTTRTDLLDMKGAFTPQTEDFLKLEFQQAASSLLSNEEGGEKRVNVFVALIAAVTAALGLLGSSLLEFGHLPEALLLASLVLFTYGLIVLRRLMGRNIHTTELINALRQIRAGFLWGHPNAVQALPFLPGALPWKREKTGWGFGKAGFVEVVAMTNCLLSGVAVGTLMWLLLPTSGVGGAALATVVAMPVLWIAQMAWSKHVYREGQGELRERRDGALSWWLARLESGPFNDPLESTFRAGVGVVIMDGDGRVLAWERSDVAGAWQLPQGGVHEGEAPTAAAWRELREETGLGPEEVLLEDALDAWLGYELPDHMRSAKTGRGQVHRWFLFRVKEGARLPPVRQSGGEFVSRQWMTLDKLADTVADFRRPVYRLVLTWLRGKV